MTACCAVAVAFAGAAVAEDAAGPTSPTPAAWVVVVHPANPARTMARSELERIFRRRTRFWPDGSAILAINLPGGTPLRRAFDGAVLRSGDEELATWWNREYFQGVVPPVVLKSSEAVRALVASTPNAIGYVEAAATDSSVAVVEVEHGR